MELSVDIAQKIKQKLAVVVNTHIPRAQEINQGGLGV
jgi:hypothetical protein